MKDYLLYLIVRAIAFILGLLPLSLSLWLGRRLGDLAYYLKKSRRQVALINIKASLSSGYSPGELKRIVKKTFQNLGQTLVEVLRFPKIDINYVNKYVTFQGLNRIDQALEKGRGVLHLTAHFGNWELSSFAASLKGYPVKVFAREQKHHRLNQLLNSYRELSGCKVIPKGMALRELIRSLHNNEIIGMVGDQNAGSSGMLVNFFKRLASTSTGPVSVALKTKAVLLPSFIIREKNIYHRVIVEEPLELTDTGNMDLDIKNGLNKFNTLLEKYIIQNPPQWLWLHKRWKRTPNRQIIILSDGKTGHLRQSQAILKIAQELSASELIQAKIIEVKFKSKIAKFFLPLFNILSNISLIGTKSYFNWALDKRSFLEIESSFANIVISCGSSLSLLNFYLARENKAKSIVIMKPPLISLSKFDLAIVPEHDRVKTVKNTVITFGPPAFIDSNFLSKEGESLKNKFNLSPKKKIGILIGGNTKRYYFNKDDINKFIDEVVNISSGLDLGLLITTSRRTPGEIEQLLKKRLTNYKNCELLVMANENNFPGAVEGILALSQVVIVSAESISMLTEAVASGKTIVALEPKIRNNSFLFRPNKHKLFLNRLIKEGYVVGTDIGQIRQVITNQKNNHKILDNKTDILSALRRIW